MKRTAAALVMLLLGACSRGPPLPAPNTAQASYDARQGAIQVMVSAVAPASTAELLSPAGNRYPAAAVTLLQGPYVAYNPPPSVSLGFGGFGFSGCCTGFGSGIGVGFPVGRPTPAAVSDQYISSAVIRVPADYTAAYPNYRVRVQVGDRTLTLPAPPPTAS